MRLLSYQKATKNCEYKRDCLQNVLRKKVHGKKIVEQYYGVEFKKNQTLIWNNFFLVKLIFFIILHLQFLKLFVGMKFIKLSTGMTLLDIPYLFLQKWYNVLNKCVSQKSKKTV
jgi:hypothetical protein